MSVLGLSAVTIVLFVGFGLLIGILFGFFGMGGSFLVMPVLLVSGYPATVAVGTGLAFVFGTSVISALNHRELGQVDYKLAAVMIPGMTVGIEVGKWMLSLFEDLGSADSTISVVYVGLLGVVGLFVLRDGRADTTCASPISIATESRALTLPPSIALSGGRTVSVWVVLVVGLGIGVLTGSLGVGGGFLLIPVMIYGFGLSTGVAVGTSVLQITVSGAFGTFSYALSNAVHVPVVAALLGGSALGARIGAGATRLVNEADFTGYFAIMLLVGSVAMGAQQLSIVYGIEALAVVSRVLVFGAAFLVSGTIVHATIDTLKRSRKRGSLPAS